MTTACLTPGCAYVPKSRGLCLSCYGTVGRLIRSGRVSDEQLVKRGKLLPRKRTKGIHKGSARMDWMLSK